MTNYFIRQNKCFLLIEASSSGTTLYSFKHNYKPNLFDNKTKLSFYGHRMSDYAINNDAEGFYSSIVNHYQVKNHIISSHCNIFYLSIHATGGMRNAQEIHGPEIIDNFYKNLSQIVTSNSIYTPTYKEIYLVNATTISGSEEGYYAWLTYNKKKDINCHAILDLGGQTFQFANSSYQLSLFLGKDRASDTIGKSVFELCSNDKKQYNGAQCREVIKLYLENNFDNIPILSHKHHCEINAISSFYYYFSDVCESYLPYITDNDLAIESQILTKIAYYCQSHKSNQSFAITLNDYKEITDEICKHWGNWEGEQADFAKELCFSGNYGYELLKILNFTEDQKINIDDVDWSLGSIISTTQYEF